ncbi:hypothetical protein BLA23254_04648 [Burkholderia lata]|uniref:NERD domain-containing protein n=1 Tax=Burkholderia lata (strain ATCC 17760 / DSM 23089 / LMG 22485 / NCIMB 9086 / R18194 / 383) TaxID=482957 RepID=A0A6P2NT55_BURL3|nr:hypothetical protein [Burkholderia lata]VWB97786.1 hypothetical protein BLA23254_04648 [Burkholderia lata]
MKSTTQERVATASVEAGAARLGARPWTDAAIQSQLPLLRAPTSSDFAWFVTAIEAALTSRHARRTEDLLCLTLQLAEKPFLEKIKTKGHFRSSRYQYDGELLRRVLTGVMERVRSKLGVDTLEYLQSVVALTTLSKGAMRVRRQLTAMLHKKKSIALKSAYAELDLMFQMSETNGRDPTSVEHSIEELGEGLSLLTHLYFDTVKVDPYRFGLIDEPGIASGEYRKVLEDAMLLRQIGEAEILVDAYGYRATSQDGHVTVQAGDEALERSIRYSYIQFQMANNIVAHESAQLHADKPTFTATVDALLTRSGQRWVNLRTSPIPRYVLSPPGTVAGRMQFRELVFQEDEIHVDVTAYNLFCKPHDLLALHLKSGFPVEEARQVQRYVDLVRKLFWQGLGKLHSPDEPISMRSRIAVFRRDDLEKFFSICVLPEYLNDVIDSLSQSRTSSGFFDIQYRPILNIDDYYVMPMNILGFSNVFRNLLQSTESRIAWPNDKDPVQVMLADALSAAGFKTRAPFQTKHHGRTLDIDVLAMKGDTLYLFECKNPLHPTGVHELRRSLNYVQEASSQLDRAIAAFEDANKRAQLFQRLGWTCPPNLRIATCVMMGNRMFNGWTVGHHPVRSVREAVRMLESGTAGVGDYIYRTLSLRHPSKADLDDYLSTRSLAVQSLKLMEPVQRSYMIGPSSLTFSTFALDFVKLIFAVDSALPRANLRTPSPRSSRRTKPEQVRSPKLVRAASRYFDIDTLAAWLQRPVKNVKKDVYRREPRVPLLVVARRRGQVRWKRNDVRKWFGIESEAEFQRKMIRRFKAAKSRMSSTTPW